MKNVFKKIYYYVNYIRFNPYLDINKIDKLLFVAHPDDEIIFFYKQLIQLDGLLVVCMTNGDSFTRSNEFVAAMKELDVKYKLLTFKDGINTHLVNEKVKKKVLQVFNIKQEWSMVLTHNQEGEYGHIQHRELNKLIREICKSRSIKVYVSCYKSQIENKVNKLSSKDKNMKINIFKKYYKSQRDMLQNLSENFEYEGLKIEE
ncbi:MAG: PIG-L family deacetylase [Clostridium sp.]|nr:PIG-L family deacetylase [Clostridium sp.]MDU7084665.1 PIG-L family deacetylase [Clostridium sp.]